VEARFDKLVASGRVDDLVARSAGVTGCHEPLLLVTVSQ
jgi:hypothetical protein